MKRFFKTKNQEQDMKDCSSPINYAEDEYKLTNEMRDEEIVANFFNSQAETYGLSSIPFDQFLADFQKKRILHEFRNNRGLILDVGTGWGRYASELTKIGLEVEGMDISTEMLKAAIAMRERKSIHHLVQGAALRLHLKIILLMVCCLSDPLNIQKITMMCWMRSLVFFNTMVN